MAVVTTRLASCGTSYLEATYDDISGNLTSFHAVATEPIHVWVWRANGTVWQEGDVGPGEVTFNAGGPIRNLSDVPTISLRC